MVLNQKNLDAIRAHIPGPDYHRNTLKAGIVHIGVGGFHRAHQAYYTHRLLEEFKNSEWGICGIGIRDEDREIHKVLTNQDGLYTLIVKHPNGDIDSRILGALIDFLPGVDNPGAVINQMAQRETKIVSLTITEGGYNFDPSTGQFDFENPDIQHDLHHPESPKTVYGYLSAALKKRYSAGMPAFTIMSCDNIQHNGDVIREMLLAFTREQEPELAKWIEKEVKFPNSMVDRITPVTTKADIAYLKDTFGYTDRLPVTCEPFIQWVIEDKFSNGRPDFEKVGVQFVSDVKPYEKMKLRLLNAGHSVLGILGAIYGHKTINACMDDQIFVAYLRAFLDDEATAVLGDIEGIDLDQYKDNLQERFSNPNIKDSVSRICSESSAKLPKFLIATLQDNLKRNGSIQYATLVIAAWCYYSDKGVDNNENPIEIIDVKRKELHSAARQTQTDPLAFLRQTSIFGNLADHNRFTSVYLEMIRKIYADADIRKHMEALL